jgi:hypothetical protein
MVTGFVQIDGQPSADQRVLLISREMSRLLGSTTTGKDGRFEMTTPTGQKRVMLLVKLQGPVIGVVHRVVECDDVRPASIEVKVDTGGGDFHRVRSTVVTTLGWPPFLVITVDPVHVASIPEPLEQFFNQRDDRVVEAHFFAMQLQGREFELILQSGTYRIGGNYINHRRSMLVKPDLQDYAIGRVEGDNENQPLAGNRYSGYLLEVKRDRELTMTVEIIPDDEISQPVS